jgi:hypothetical protein
MERGINGNLAEMSDGNGNEARVEINQVFDCTTSKYYHSVAADLRKLKEARPGFAGELFLAVFFVQMPNLKYAKHLGPRHVVCVGIPQQYRQLSDVIGSEPFWTTHGPMTLALTLPKDEQTRTALEARFRSVHGPKSGLSVDDALKDATVGVSLWEFVRPG